MTSSHALKLIIVILGPTASGKSDLAVKIAKKFNGEVISADSRQLYKGLDIGTGKITKKEMREVPHHLLNIASPKRKFTVVQYRKLALKAIDKILKKDKIPILCGGTGFYIQAVIDGILIPEVPPDWKLRKKLEKNSAKGLYKILEKLDPRRAKTIEKENPRRLIRAIEIVMKTKKPVPVLKKNPLPYPVLMLGIKKQDKELKNLIKKRFLRWLESGLLQEVKKLRKSGLSWKKIENFGIHYGVIARYLQKKINCERMVENSVREIQNYAKRQITWFKRDKRIEWIENYQKAQRLTKKFIHQNGKAR
jgi:tRNA dimethylallyltransferase